MGFYDEDDENDKDKFNPDITNVCKAKVNIEKPIVDHIDKGLPVKLTKSVPKPTVASKSVSKPTLALQLAVIAWGYYQLFMK